MTLPRRTTSRPTSRRALRSWGRPLATLTGLALCASALAACGGSGFDDKGGSGDSGGKLTVLIGSSGDAETASVKKAVAAWSKSSGKQAQVVVASDLTQQLSQGFASNNPPDVFYASPDQVQTYAAKGSMYAYGDQVDASSFYPALTQAFTVDGKLQCAPKDSSTLQLVINDQLWKQAGLTDADVPTTWDQLEQDATKLTQGNVTGLVTSPEIARLGAFFAQAGGGLTNQDGTEATVDSSQNVQAMDYVKGMMDKKVMAFSSDLGAGWGGEAFGKQQAAMTIEGSWLLGAMKADYPDVSYTIAPLPEGPGGKGTLAFTNCWGIPTAGDTKDAVDLVKTLTSSADQTQFADDFGVIPSVQATAEQWGKDNPKYEPFIDGAAYAQNLPAQPGTADVISDFNSQLATLKDTDPKTILSSVQTELQAALDADQ